MFRLLFTHTAIVDRACARIKLIQQQYPSSGHADTHLRVHGAAHPVAAHPVAAPPRRLTPPPCPAHCTSMNRNHPGAAAAALHVRAGGPADAPPPARMMYPPQHAMVVNELRQPLLHVQDDDERPAAPPPLPTPAPRPVPPPRPALDVLKEPLRRFTPIVVAAAILITFLFSYLSTGDSRTYMNSTQLCVAYFLAAGLLVPMVVTQLCGLAFEPPPDRTGAWTLRTITLVYTGVWLAQTVAFVTVPDLLQLFYDPNVDTAHSASWFVIVTTVWWCVLPVTRVVLPLYLFRDWKFQPRLVDSQPGAPEAAVELAQSAPQTVDVEQSVRRTVDVEQNASPSAASSLVSRIRRHFSPAFTLSCALVIQLIRSTVDVFMLWYPGTTTEQYEFMGGGIDVRPYLLLILPAALVPIVSDLRNFHLLRDRVSCPSRSSEIPNENAKRLGYMILLETFTVTLASLAGRVFISVVHAYNRTISVVIIRVVFLLINFIIESIASFALPEPLQPLSLFVPYLLEMAIMDFMFIEPPSMTQSYLQDVGVRLLVLCLRMRSTSVLLWALRLFVNPLRWRWFNRTSARREPSDERFVLRSLFKQSAHDVELSEAETELDQLERLHDILTDDDVRKHFVHRAHSKLWRRRACELRFEALVWCKIMIGGTMLVDTACTIAQTGDPYTNWWWWPLFVFKSVDPPVSSASDRSIFFVAFVLRSIVEIGLVNAARYLWVCLDERCRRSTVARVHAILGDANLGVHRAAITYDRQVLMTEVKETIEKLHNGFETVWDKIGQVRLLLLLYTAYEIFAFGLVIMDLAVRKANGSSMSSSSSR